jgi:transposase
LSPPFFKADDPVSQWVSKLKERSGWQKPAVALANKNARILWAVMTKGIAFDARHVSVKPGVVIPAASPAAVPSRHSAVAHNA